MISIITPVYNGERFVEQCILNVVAQKCSNLEHIFIDGGSTDKTLEIIASYASHNTHIRWISERDQGQSDAMNKGIRLSKGNILGFLNVDDYYEPDILNRINSIFNGLEDPSFVVGNCNIVNESGEVIVVNKPSRLKLRDLLILPKLTPYPCNPSAYFYHKSLHGLVGVYLETEHFAMDLDFILRAIQEANVYYFDEVWGNFRLCKGTKTFQDMRNGNMHYRIDSIVKKYRRDLSYRQKIEIYIISFFSSTKALISAIKKRFKQSPDRN